MYTMKCDMSGAGAVFAATRAIADLGLKIKITTYGSLAENMPSGSAYRPSDVLTTYGGKTVENFNSDAEGRIVMADALARLSAEDKPDMIIDVATLTGACITALGERTAGVMSNREDVAARILQAAAASGERFWELPIVEEARGFLDSEVADLKSGRSGPGGAMTAAAFLREFIGDIPWAHLDIAGPAFNSGGGYGYVPSGGTGIGVRTLVALAEQLAG
jgi:leucyl aminopeptidase